jgi:Tol biopolymer transport system component/DNA-binding winged helix-turn-helix (wHTH) protein
MMDPKLSVFRFSEFEVAERELRITRLGAVVPLEPKALRVLIYLLRNPDRIISKDELLDAVWGDTAVTENSLTRAIALLRRTLDDDIHQPRFILTIPAAGYRFIAPVAVSPNSSAAHDPAGADLSQMKRDTDSGKVVATGPKSESGPQSRRKRLLKWRLPGAAVLAGVAIAVWYMQRPLPLPRITEYRQLTFDGHNKMVAGTDGARLYFNLDQGDTNSIRQMAVSGGVSEPVPIESPNPVAFRRGLSPDGSSMLVWLPPPDLNIASPVSIVHLPEGSLRNLTDAVSAAWSPDGTLVVYSTADGDINLIQSDGTGTRKLAGVGGTSVGSLSWSPDGRAIRFFKDDRPWEMSPSGSNVHELLGNWRPSYRTCCGQWTANGESFVFAGGHLQGNIFQSDLWALDERHVWFGKPSAEPVQLTSGPLHWGGPVLSEDGRKIFADGSIDRGELVRFNAKSHTFEPFLGGISAESVDFSRDGKSVAYVSYPEGILWKANADGSKPVQLSEPPMYVAVPRWSPDGSQIVFMSEPFDGVPKLYVVSSAGGSLRPLVPEDNGAQDNPNWSPDGRKIAFSRLPDVRLSQRGFRGNTRGIIYILDLATHQVSTLPGSEGFWGARWSPDGRLIQSRSDDALSIKIFDFTTQRAWVLPIEARAEWDAWSRDGRFIYFASDMQGHPGVFRIRVQGGKPEIVVDLKGFRSTGLFTAYFGLDPTDAPLLLRFNGSDDLYALTLEKK